MNDQSDTPKLWAKQGDTVCCLKGHPICDIAHDIYLGDPRQGSDFTNWQQPEPDKATAVPAIRCAICKAVWLRQVGRSYQFHFAEGWR